MRLGDLDALKKCAIPCEIHNGALTDLCVPLYQIDNAQIVPLPDFKAGYKQAILDGKTNFSRPNGAWKVKNFDEETGISDSCWCPFCGMVKAQVYNNFCGYCGADLRGEKE